MFDIRQTKAEIIEAASIQNDKLVMAYSDINDFREENARLRAALESLTKDPPATLDEPDTDAEVIIKMREIARQAIQ